MKLSRVCDLLDAKAVCKSELFNSIEVERVCGCDLLSDVLAFSQEKSLLLTGLTNPQVVRTAEMTEISAIIFVRGKTPPGETIDLANENGLALAVSDKPLFECCGILYEKGLKPEKIEKI